MNRIIELCIIELGQVAYFQVLWHFQANQETVDHPWHVELTKYKNLQKMQKMQKMPRAVHKNEKTFVFIFVFVFVYIFFFLIVVFIFISVVFVFIFVFVFVFVFVFLLFFSFNFKFYYGTSRPPYRYKQNIEIQPLRAVLRKRFSQNLDKILEKRGNPFPIKVTSQNAATFSHFSEHFCIRYSNYFSN